MSRSTEKTARELEAFAKRERRRLARERVKQLGKELRAARVERKERMRASVQLCRDARARLRVDVQQRRRELQAAIAAERHAARYQCQASRDATREQTLTKVSAVAKNLAHARTARRLLANAPRSTSKAAAALVTAGEARAESDHAVRVNLPRELVPVFDAVRREIHASPRRSRTEAFLEWATDHPARVYEIQHAAHEKWIRDMEREARQLGRGVLGVAPAVRLTDEWGG